MATSKKLELKPRKMKEVGMERQQREMEDLESEETFTFIAVMIFIGGIIVIALNIILFTAKLGIDR